MVARLAPGMERRKLNTSLKAGGLDPNKQARQERRLAFVNRKMGKKAPRANAPVPSSNQPQAPESPAMPMQDPQKQALAPNDNSALFPNQRAFEYQNWQGSPLYQFQQTEGLKAIDRKLAAEGKLGSGFQFDQYRNFLTNLGAQESERASGVAQQEANRLQQMQENESQRRERASNSAWDRQFSVMQLMSQQNPMGYAVNGTNNLGDAYGQMANKRYDYLSSQYPRASGGGGYVAPPYLPPVPSGPDYSGFNAQQSQNDAVQNNNYYNAFTSFLSGLGAQYKQNNPAK